MTALVQVQDLKKTYQTGSVRFEALRGVSLEVEQGDFVAIMGESGSGKSTLLHIVGGLDKPTAGSVLVTGQRLDSLSETQLALFRRAENSTFLAEKARKDGNPAERAKGKAKMGIGRPSGSSPSSCP